MVCMFCIGENARMVGLVCHLGARMAWHSLQESHLDECTYITILITLFGISSNLLVSYAIAISGPFRCISHPTGTQDASDRTSH
ncbi:hypothetical protein SODALDRAFT_164331 [Sodiomyces alkalinus F11]|uniref:Uncharacterized protein n=1 Tax=Sodiomyces alkalinus (strain CBS 110278 / VKM F-3762 / F11) TaxID=1314773 RepID=A0A3N2PVK9_SODAK|nr:hypothetical protein SODALDRAFT_164331 [Sodiomyces alkalinus F11]ROT38530.1 hypothetical protein SODALDRAFT_164331 [Sodiomyces alkalinus F11]